MTPARDQHPSSRHSGGAQSGWIVVLAGLLASLSGCLPMTAGYAPVRHDIGDRMPGLDVRWDRHDERAEIPAAWTREPLSGDRAARWALWRNPAIQSAFADLGIARAALAGALRLPNPNVEASLGFAGRDDDPSLELNLNMSLTSLINLPNRRRVGEGGMTIAQTRAVQRSVQVAYDARRAFVDAVAAEQTLALQKTSLAAAVASALAAAELLEAGNVARLLVVNEQAMVAELRILVSDSEANALLQRQKLATALGLEPGEALPPLPLQLPDMPARSEDMKGLAQLANERNLDLAIIRAQYAVAAAQADSATVQAALPHLEVGMRLDRADGASALGPVVGMAIPMFDQGQGPIGMASAEMERAQAEHRRVNIMLEQSIKATITRLALRRAQVNQFQQTLLPIRAAVLDETLLQYNAMSLGVFQLLQARRDQIRSQVAFIAVLRDYWTAQLDLEQLSKGAMPPAAGMVATEGVMATSGASAGH